jgi:hypothetical protein
MPESAPPCFLDAWYSSSSSANLSVSGSLLQLRICSSLSGNLSRSAVGAFVPANSFRRATTKELSRIGSDNRVSRLFSTTSRYRHRLPCVGFPIKQAFGSVRCPVEVGLCSVSGRKAITPQISFHVPVVHLCGLGLLWPGQTPPF